MFKLLKRCISSCNNIENSKLDRKIRECLNLTVPIIKMRNDQVELELRKMEGKFSKHKKCQKTISLIERTLKDFNVNLYNTIKIYQPSNNSVSSSFSGSFSDSSSSPTGYIEENEKKTNNIPYTAIEDNYNNNDFEHNNNNNYEHNTLTQKKGEKDVSNESSLGLEDSYLNKLNNIFNYILNTKSKLFRPYLSLLVYYLIHSNSPNHLNGYNNPNSHGDNDVTINNYEDNSVNNYNKEELDRLRILLNSYELVHIGSLVHDDLIDNSMLRRNRTCPHVLFGPKTSVLVGDYLLAKSSQQVVQLGNLQIINKLTQTLQDLIHGELFCINVDKNMYSNYFKKIYLKTSSLIANNISSIPLLLNKNELNELFYLVGVHIGICFQICDDLLDYNSSVSTLGKPILSDLKSGILTLPLIYSIYNNKNILKMLLSYKLINRNQDNSDNSDTNNNNNTNTNTTNSYKEDEEKKNVIEKLILMINSDKNENYYNKCKLCILYHLNEVLSLLEQHNFRHFNTLIQYIYEIVNRK